MDLTLTRFLVRPDGIFSRLSNPQGETLAVTLEHAFGNPQSGYGAKLPIGTYACQRGTHRLAHGPEFETFEVTGVTGHSGILFHVGNFNIDSDGCILLGTAFSEYGDNGGFMITNSRMAFSSFMAIQAGVTTFELTVR